VARRRVDPGWLRSGSGAAGRVALCCRRACPGTQPQVGGCVGWGPDGRRGPTGRWRLGHWGGRRADGCRGGRCGDAFPVPPCACRQPCASGAAGSSGGFGVGIANVGAGWSGPLFRPASSVPVTPRRSLGPAGTRDDGLAGRGQQDDAGRDDAGQPSVVPGNQRTAQASSGDAADQLDSARAWRCGQVCAGGTDHHVSARCGRAVTRRPPRERTPRTDPAGGGGSGPEAGGASERTFMASPSVTVCTTGGRRAARSQTPTRGQAGGAAQDQTTTATGARIQE